MLRRNSASVSTGGSDPRVTRVQSFQGPIPALHACPVWVLGLQGLKLSGPVNTVGTHRELEAKAADGVVENGTLPSFAETVKRMAPCSSGGGPLGYGNGSFKVKPRGNEH